MDIPSMPPAPPPRIHLPRSSDGGSVLVDARFLELCDLMRFTSLPEGDLVSFTGLVPELEAHLDADRPALPLSSLGDLVFMTVLPLGPETLALQTAFGPRAGAAMFSALDRLTRATRDPAPSWERTLFDEDIARALDGDVVRRLFLGRSLRRPHHARIAHAVALLRRAAAHTRVDCGGLYSVLAWLEWARRRSAIAAAYANEGVTVSPTHRLAPAVRDLIRSGRPRWVEY